MMEQESVWITEQCTISFHLMHSKMLIILLEGLKFNVSWIENFFQWIYMCISPSLSAVSLYNDVIPGIHCVHVLMFISSCSQVPSSHW